MIGLIREKNAAWRARTAGSADSKEVMHLSEALHLSPLAARLLIGRGLRSPFDAKRFLSPSIDLLHDPFLFEGMAPAVSRILSAIERSDKILIYGDYDVDGMTGTALLIELFRSLSYPVAYYIPDRFKEGYGLHAAALREAASDGTTLVITCDCGSTAHTEIAEAARLGIDVIVVDHHRIDGPPPPATAVLNPYVPQKRPYPFAGLSSVGVAFKLAEAMFGRCGLSALALRPLLDLVALGAVADVAPLVGENRYLVKEGLEVIREGKRPGLAALFQQAGAAPGSATERTVAYTLVPRLNAAGRLYHANEAVALLTTTSYETSLVLAERLDRYNQERQEIEAKIWEEADRQVRETKDLDRQSVLVVSSEGWHPGVVGIVASRLVERYQIPAVVIDLSPEGVGRGSGRSAGGIDLFQAVSSCSQWLDRFGGHAGAVGLTIRREQIQPFREALAETLSLRAIVEADETNWIDAEIDLEALTFRLMAEMEPLAPFGSGHPAPVFVARGLSIVSLRREPDRPVHFKVRNQKGWTFDVVAPRHLGFDWESYNEGATIDLFFTPEQSSWRGEARIFLRLKGIHLQREREDPR